ncbi:hypothetical protein SLA2020_376560, partial [Shorea laevis]
MQLHDPVHIREPEHPVTGLTDNAHELRLLALVQMSITKPNSSSSTSSASLFPLRFSTLLEV